MRHRPVPALFCFPEDEVLEKISYRLRIAMDSAVGRYMARTLNQVGQVVFDYWREYVAHEPAWKAARLILENAAIPSQICPRSVEEMLDIWLSISIRLGVTWPKMTGEQLEEMNEYRRLLNEAVDLIDSSARTFDRIGRNVARAIESFGVSLETVKDPRAHDELTIIMGLLHNLSLEGINSHEDVMEVVQRFIVSHLGRLSIQESASTGTASLQVKLQEALAGKRQIEDELKAARELLNTQENWERQQSAAQEMIVTLETTIGSLEARLAKMPEQTAASDYDPRLHELQDEHLSVLREISLLRAQQERTAQAMAHAQEDHKIALEHRKHNAMNRRLDALIDSGLRLREIGETITHLEKIRKAVEGKIDDRMHELQAADLGKIYFGTERPGEFRAIDEEPTADSTGVEDASIWELIDEYPAPNTLLKVTDPRLQQRLSRFRGDKKLMPLSNFLRQVASGEIRATMDAWQEKGTLRTNGRATLEELIEHVRSLPFFTNGSPIEDALLAYYQEAAASAKAPFVIGRLYTQSQDRRRNDTAELLKRVEENASFLVGRKFLETFRTLIALGVVRSLRELLEHMPERSEFRKEVKRQFRHRIFMPSFDGLCLRLRRLDIWNEDKSALDPAKFDALIATQGS